MYSPDSTDGNYPSFKEPKEKLRTPNERQEVFYSYLDHLKSGKAKRSFHNKVLFEAAEAIPARYPEEFPEGIHEIELAKAARRDYFEDIMIKNMKGKMKGNGSILKLWCVNVLGMKDETVTENKITWDAEKIKEFEEKALST